MKNKIRFVFFLTIILCYSGCTIVNLNITESEDSVTSSSYLGYTKIAIDINKVDSVTYSSVGFGLSHLPTGTSLGFRKETTAIVNNKNRCQTIFWITNMAEAENLLSYIKSKPKKFNNLCVVNGE